MRFRNKYTMILFSVTIFLLASLLAILYIDFWPSSRLKTQNTRSFSRAQPPSLPSQEHVDARQRLGLEHGWVQINQLDSAVLATAISVKAIFLLANGNTVKGRSVLVSEKRDRSNYRANHRWEFLGGRINSGESCFDALLRELKEEDPTGVLHELLLKSSDESVLGKVVHLKNQERHFIVKIDLDQSLWLRLNQELAQYGRPSKESYGFFLVPLESLDLRYSVRKQWTPKSRKILAALRL